MFKIAVDDVAELPVKITLKNKGEPKTFAFSVTAKRVAQSTLDDFMSNKEKNFSDFMRSLITGWANQRLVCNEDGTPADFGPDALDVMLDVQGVSLALFNAYYRECAAKEKN